MMRIEPYTKRLNETLPVPEGDQLAAVDSLIQRTQAEMRRRPLHRRLSLALERVLRNVPQARSGLRLLVQSTLNEAADGGEDPARVSAVLLDFFCSHPLFDRFERVSMVTGSRMSEQVLADIRNWLGEGAHRRSLSKEADALPGLAG